MLVLLVFLLSAVLWGFFHARPPHAPRGRLMLCDAAILAVALAGAAASALPLHADALARHPDQRFMAAYLATIAGGAALMILVIAGGLVRNLVLFRRP